MSSFFQAGGTVNSASACYIARACDRQALETIFSRRYLVVLGPRQVGKTSLLFKLQTTLARRAIPSAIVDLSIIQGSEKGDSASSWYNLLAAQLHRQLKRNDADIYHDQTAYDLPS